VAQDFSYSRASAARARTSRAAETVTADNDRSIFERIALEVSDVARRPGRDGEIKHLIEVAVVELSALSVSR
jgi:hypothetical protein